MNVTNEIINGIPKTTYEIQVQDLIGKQMHSYALLLLIISAFLLFYVLWNNFVRSPSKPIGLKQALKNNLDAEKQVGSLFDEELGIEPSSRVKKISRAMDGYILIPALVLFYISLSYYLSIG